ncbi:MAG: sigma-70 family RNA polymerase sigma factor [Candidatus Paceibacterota bacterium]
MSDGDKNLIERAMAGEAEAFGQLYDKYQSGIYRFIYLKVGLREEAEDLTHQVFLKSWRNMPSYNFKGFPFSSWLYSIARNQVIDFYRLKKDVVELESIAELKTESDSQISFDKKTDLERVKNAIIKLNDEQQSVIIFRFIEDMSISETALALDKSESAVKLLQYRAIKNLKKIIDG